MDAIFLITMHVQTQDCGLLSRRSAHADRLLVKVVDDSVLLSLLCGSQQV